MDTEHTIGELARKHGIRAARLQTKAHYLGLNIQGDQLSPDEFRLLDTVAGWKNERIKGFVSGLAHSDNTAADLLAQINLQESSAEMPAIAGMVTTLVERLDKIERQVADIRRELAAQARVQWQWRADTASATKDLAALTDQVNRLQSGIPAKAKERHAEGILELQTRILDAKAATDALVASMASQTESLAEHGKSLEALKRDGQETRRKVDTLTETIASQEAQNEHMARLEELCEQQARRTDALAERIETFTAAADAEWSAVKERVQRALTGSGDAGSRSLQLRPLKDTLAAFKNAGLAYHVSVIQELRAGLRRGHMRIVGPPGTGKTTLMKKVECFVPQSARPEAFYHEVSPDWTSYDVLGGKAVLGGRIGLHLGVFTEAVLSCLESGRMTFLLLDETNRARLDDVFGGLMDSLLPGAKSMSFHELGLMFKNRSSLPLPGNFRLLCAMNEADFRFLQPMSRQLARRFDTVDLSKVDHKAEREILRRRIPDYGRRLLGRLDSKQRSKRDAHHQLVKLVFNLRQRLQEQAGESCLFGTSYVLEAQDYITHGRGTADQLDEAIARWIVPQLVTLERGVLKTIADELFGTDDFPQTTAAIATMIDGRG